MVPEEVWVNGTRTEKIITVRSGYIKFRLHSNYKENGLSVLNFNLLLIILLIIKKNHAFEYIKYL